MFFARRSVPSTGEVHAATGLDRTYRNSVMSCMRLWEGEGRGEKREEKGGRRKEGGGRRKEGGENREERREEGGEMYEEHYPTTAAAAKATKFSVGHDFHYPKQSSSCDSDLPLTLDQRMVSHTHHLWKKRSERKMMVIRIRNRRKRWP